MKKKGFTPHLFRKKPKVFILGPFSKKGKGFTLIELLVVMAIIGLLASMVTVYLNSARIKARDVRRKADLKQIRLALEMYKEANGKYPRARTCNYGTNCYTFSTYGSNWIPELVTKQYLSSVPVDPINNRTGPWTTGNYSYAYGNVTGDGQAYDLTAQLENRKDPDRCELKCYRWYFDNRFWCRGVGCTTGSNYSLYIYEDSPLTP